MALVDGVYDKPPPNPWGAKQAYITLGPSDVVTDDVDCVWGAEITFQLDAWTRQAGSLGAAPTCRKVVDAVKTALHQKDLDLTDNALVEMMVNFRRVILDPDGLTNHGLVMVTAVAEESVS